MNLLCSFSILVRDLEREEWQQLKFDRTKLFTRTFFSRKPKNLINLISAFSCFSVDLQIRFIVARNLVYYLFLLEEVLFKMQLEIPWSQF